jgi:putative salt-induced outer membrane protein
MMLKQAALAFAGALVLAGVARADDPAPADISSDGSWAMRALAGYSKTGGNTDTSSANGLFHVAHTYEDWKFLFGAEGVYGSTKGETTAQAWDVHGQANYNFTTKFYGYAGLSYNDDKFSGFAYQELVSTGVGYQFIKTDATKLTGQIGVGERRLRPEMLDEDALGAIIGTTELPSQSDTVLDALVNLDHSFTSTTKIIASAAIESGHLNTMTTYGIALQVKMSSLLSLSAGYGLVRNSSPPAGVGKDASLTTLNLVYELKNKNLAPE